MNEQNNNNGGYQGYPQDGYYGNDPQIAQDTPTTGAQPYYGTGFENAYSQGAQYQQPQYQPQYQYPPQMAQPQGAQYQQPQSEPIKQKPQETVADSGVEKKVKAKETQTGGGVAKSTVAGLLVTVGLVMGVIGFFIGRLAPSVSVGGSTSLAPQSPSGPTADENTGDVGGEEGGEVGGVVLDYFDGGTGTESDPYIITTADQLMILADKVNRVEDNLNYAHFMLGSDIDLSEVSWIPIGTEYSADGETLSYATRFYGGFDGNGYTINNLKIYTTGNTVEAGLFGNVADGAYVRNVCINGLDIDISAERYAYIGGIAGNCDGAIENCVVNGEIRAESAGTVYAGLVVGQSFGAITGCEANGIVNAEGDNTAVAGTLAGRASYKVSGCTAYGEIYAKTTVAPHSWPSGTWAGGLIGAVSIGSIPNELIIENCSSNGRVEAIALGNDVYAGALCGDLAGTLINCESAANVYARFTGEADNGQYRGVYAGGITGYMQQGSEVLHSIANGVILAESAEGVYVGGMAGLCGEDARVVGCEYHSGTLSAVSYGDNTNYNRSGAYAGGIVGVADASVIEACHFDSMASVSALCSADNIVYVGGILGGVGNNIYFTPAISDCYSEGDVIAASADACVGGIAGAIRGSISHCYSTSRIDVMATGDVLAGGIVGDIDEDASVYGTYSCAKVGVSALDGVYPEYIHIGKICGSGDSRVNNSYTFDYAEIYYDESENTRVWVSAVGEAMDSVYLLRESFYTETLGFDADTWNFSEYMHEGFMGPELKSVEKTYEDDVYDDNDVHDDVYLPMIPF